MNPNIPPKLKHRDHTYLSGQQQERGATFGLTNSPGAPPATVPNHPLWQRRLAAALGLTAAEEQDGSYSNHGRSWLLLWTWPHQPGPRAAADLLDGWVGIAASEARLEQLLPLLCCCQAQNNSQHPTERTDNRVGWDSSWASCIKVFHLFSSKKLIVHPEARHFSNFIFYSVVLEEN